MPDSRRLAGGALLLLPAGIVSFFAFNSGGFYPGPPAYVATLLSIILALRVTMAPDPFEGLGVGLILGGGAFALYALNILLSQVWSHSPGHALVEFGRALVYLLAMLLFGSIAHTPGRLTWALRALAVAIVGICVCGLITRLLPHVWPITPELTNNRLSFPLTYWNALGLVSAMGLVLCLHFSSDVRETVANRVGAAAAAPIVAATTYFTFSRGGIAAAVIGIVIYTLIARPRALINAVAAIAPAIAVAVKVAYDANLLATQTPTTPPAIVQGRHVAVAVFVCAAGAGLIRLLLAVALDRRLERFAVPARSSRIASWVAWGGLALGVLIAVIALQGTITHEIHGFVHPPKATGNDLRLRLTDPSNNGRIELWRVAWHQFQNAPALGHGAGTFQNTWAQYRPNQDFVLDAHSLYLETLDEQGILGFALLMATLAVAVVVTARRARGHQRPLYASLLTLMLIWALHAAVDWDWEMPAVTLPFFALGGLALSRPLAGAVTGAPAHARGSTPPYARIALGVGCLLLGVAPAYLWISQRRLDQATRAFAASDCRTATQAAQSSISILGDRPEPYEVISYCDIRRDMPVLAIAAIQKAISLDPGNWNYVYDLAVMRASAGLDPMAAARRALRLNPQEPLIQQALQTFAKDDRSQRERDGKAIADQFTSL